MSTENGRISQAARKIKQGIIDHELRPEITERKAYENTIYRYILYFRSQQTINELRGNKTKYFNADANGETFDVRQVPDHEHEYTITSWDSDSDASQPTRSLTVAYNDDNSLRSFQFFGAHDTMPTSVTINEDGKTWSATQITTDSLGKIGSAKREMETRAREMYGFLRDFYMSYIPSVEGIDGDVVRNLQILERYKTSREVELRDRLFLAMNRREFLKTVGFLAAGAVFLAACGPGVPGVSSPDLQQQYPELQGLIEYGAMDEAKHQIILRAEDEGLGAGAKNILYTFLASRTGERFIAGNWEKVATPSFLSERGIVVGNDLKEVFRFKQRNGGYLFYDLQTNTYLKLSPEGTNDANYLRQAANNYRKGWTAAGMPEEVISKIQVVDGFTYEGKPSVLLATPNMGQTLETYTKFLKANNAANAEAILSSMLERYYIETLIPMNAAGVFQKDPNFKNICLFQQADGTVKLVPIDLAQKPMAFEQAQIFQSQYEELARRALGNGRSITMPSYTEFLQRNPEIAKQMSLMAQMGETVRINMSIPGESSKVLAVIPQHVIGEDASTGNFMGKIVQSIESQYGAAYRQMPQGSLMPVEVTLETGEVTRVMIIKANPIGDPIAKFGGKWGELLRLGKTGFRLASEFLFIMWIASEVGQITDPDYSAKLFSDIAFPDSVSWRDNAYATIEDVYNRLMTAKKSLATRTSQAPMAVTPVAEQMFGVTQRELLDLITKGFMTHGEIIEVLNEMAPRAAFPPAPAQVEFMSPFPIIVDGAQLPMSAMFSAFLSEENQQVVLFWGQTQNAEGKLVTMPITAFQKYPEEKEWKIIPIVDKPWTVQFNIHEDLLTLTCKNAVSDGKTFELECFK